MIHVHFNVKIIVKLKIEKNATWLRIVQTSEIDLYRNGFRSFYRRDCSLDLFKTNQITISVKITTCWSNLRTIDKSSNAQKSICVFSDGRQFQWHWNEFRIATFKFQDLQTLVFQSIFYFSNFKLLANFIGCWNKYLFFKILSILGSWIDCLSSIETESITSLINWIN